MKAPRAGFLLVNRLIFETDGTVVTTYRGGAVPQVEYVEGCS